MFKRAKAPYKPDLTREIEVTCKTPDERAVKKRKIIVVEHSLEVSLNRKPLLELNCSPNQLEELVLGHLYGEGLIRDNNDIVSCELTENGAAANVVTVRESGKKISYLTLGKPGRSKGLDEENRHSEMLQKNSLQRLPGHFWNADDIFSLSAIFHTGSPLYLKTRGMHSCMLCVGQEMVFCGEDIGRHNAIDKVIGYALKNRIETSRAIVFSSGRIPSDVVRKVIRCGFPVLVTNSVPTEQAVALACHYNLTLLGEVKNGNISIFAG